ncbi:MAG TPA: GDP-mannose 4,6-dehydratase, partial [Anaerolineales bacterium]|nr:GDP-mannose 4,6-dehydratase [Anaerolineales bacterium]
ILELGVPGETYNIGGGNQPSNLTIVKTICEILDELQPGPASYRGLIQHVADRPGHDRRYAMDIRKIRTTLGWEPRHSLADGLSKTVQWYLQHADWTEAIRHRTDYQTWMDSNYQRREGNK